MRLFDLFDEDLYEEMWAKGYITERYSPLGLTILNYTAKTQYEKKWNEVTLNCRGLIVRRENYDLDIVARPFPKFFNLGEGPALFDMDSPVEVTDKVDGSLGILYPIRKFPADGMGWAVATRGSFDSNQAIHATRKWQDKYALKMTPEGLDFIDQYTVLFEIVYPENRVVLDYDGMDDLILLGAVHIEYGYILGPTAAASMMGWTGPITEVFSYKTMQEAFSAEPRPNAEGYVVRSGQNMVKIKQADYVHLHRLISNLSTKSVWQGIKSGKSAADICDDLPDEFHGFVTETWSKLAREFHELHAKIVFEFDRIMQVVGPSPSRKDFAFASAMSEYRKYMFLLLDERPISDMIWDDIKPKGDDRQVIEDE